MWRVPPPHELQQCSSQRTDGLFVITHSLLQVIRILVDFVDGTDRMTCLDFVLVENADVLLGSIEMQTADGLAIVIVEQNTEVALGIALDNTLGINH